MEIAADVRAYDALSQHTRRVELGAMARAVMARAVEARRLERNPARVEQLMAEHSLTRDESATPFGNAADILERGPRNDDERALACALAAHAVGLAPPDDRDDEDRVARDLLWLAAHTHFDAMGLLDRALGERAAGVWSAVADRVRRVAEGRATMPDRGEALLAAVALVNSPSHAASVLASELARDLSDPMVGRVLGAQGRGPELAEPVRGELGRTPRGPFVTALLALTGVLLVLHVARAFGRLALDYKRPAEVTFAGDALRVRWRTEILGRTFGDRDLLVPRAALARATREVRYPRLALYAGLIALAIGSYLGVAVFVDGVRAGAPSLLACGLVLAALGLALDFALFTVAPGAQGRCRLLFVPKSGRRVCVSDVEPGRADAMLARLSRG
jgi:hypothetical protein